MLIGDWLYRLLTGLMDRFGKPPETRGKETEKVLEEAEYIKEQAGKQKGEK